MGPTSLTRPLGNSVSFGDGGERMKRKEGQEEDNRDVRLHKYLKNQPVIPLSWQRDGPYKPTAWASVDSVDARQSSQRS